VSHPLCYELSGMTPLSPYVDICPPSHCIRKWGLWEVAKTWRQSPIAGISGVEAWWGYNAVPPLWLGGRI
jgi:hypothetical protein